MAAFNLLVLLSPTLAAFFSFRLCHYITGRIAPSLVGGFLFGFSGYMFGQMLGHLNLMLIFLIPLGVEIVLRHINGEISRRRFIISIAAVIAGQALLSTEILFTGLIFGAIGLLAAAVFTDSQGRRQIRRTTIDVVTGGAVAAVVIAPFLYYALFYTSPPPFLSAARFSMDALNPLVPTPVEWIGGTSFSPVAATFQGAYAETGGYLGIAVVLLAAWWLIATWRSAASRVMLVVLGCAVLGSLGTSLHIAGQPTISLPWKLLAELPLFHEVIPTRLAMYTGLVVAIAVAQALATSAGSPVLRWSLALIGCVMLVPTGGSAFFHSDPPEPAFFTSDEYKRYISHQEVVLALPFSQNGQSLLWQARADMWFRLAGGYFGQEPPQDYLEESALAQFYSEETDAETPCLLKSFIERRDVGAVVVESGVAETWRPGLSGLGLRPHELGGVDFYAVPQTLAAPARCS
jgi:hypothetical protein